MNYYEMLLARKLAKGELPPNAYLLKEASGSLVSFSDGADLPMPSFVCNIDANQDLHGYDAPWAGGVGKNILPMTVDGIKTANTDGTWTGNACALNGITYTILTDNDGNVTGIKANGTASANAILELNPTGSLTIPANTTFSLSGCPEGGGGSTYRLYPKGGTSATFDNGSGKLITLDSEITNPFRINVYSGAQVNNIIFYPMIVFTNAIDMDFAPYSNICPISGHTGVDAVISPTTEASAGTTIAVSWQTEAGEVFGGYVDLVSGELTVVRVSTTINGNNINYISASSQIDVLGGKRLSTNIANAKYTNNTAIPNIDSDRLVVVSANSIFSDTGSNCVSVNDLNQITLRYKGVATLEDAQDLLNAEPVQIVYELATPITYQLTPTQIKSLLGKNNAWCSTGDVILEYFGKGAE